MKPIFCPKCQTGSFILYEDSDEIFCQCTNFWCSWKVKIETIAETLHKVDE